MVAKFHGGAPPPIPNRKQKHMGVAYLLLILLCVFGAYRFYIGDMRAGSSMLLIALAALASLVFGVVVQTIPLGGILAVVLVIWLAIDVVQTGRLIRRYNLRQTMRWDA